MKAKVVMITTACGIMLLAAGCRKNAVDKIAFKSAIDQYLSSRPECLWTYPVKFPAQADTSKEDQTKGFDALTDAGFLTRSSAEKKRFLIGSKQVNDYDLSDKGRATWTADATQPGFGNFCIGHREVTTIDGYTPADNPDATQFSVTFHYDVAGAPGWASSPEMKTAFPSIAADLAGQQTRTATLAKTDNSWQVSSMLPMGSAALPQ